jgi:hypothetical protein
MERSRGKPGWIRGRANANATAVYDRQDRLWVAFKTSASIGQRRGGRSLVEAANEYRSFREV